MNRSAFSVVLVVPMLAMTGCVDQAARSVERGNEMFNLGNCGLAYNEGSKAAGQGSAAAMQNMALLYDSGCPQMTPPIPVDHNVARQWRAWADQKRQSDAEATAAAISAFAQALGQAAQARSASPPPPPAYIPYTPATPIRAPTTAAPAAVTINTGCSSDLECGVGNVCVRAAGQVAINGTCMRSVDRYGNQVLTQVPQPRVTTVPLHL